MKQTNSSKPAPAGGVFEQLGFTPQEAVNLRLRARLMNILIARIEAAGITQVKASRLMGVTQPCVSDVMRGRIDRFSLDTLVEMLAASGLPHRP
ncbi:MAG: XRE family transcriptional regulator [Candidatus Solibacter usitatus]|nr:XRE family transcriptional regulator [Candidatus Solibacter usitatus]